MSSRISHSIHPVMPRASSRSRMWSEALDTPTSIIKGGAQPPNTVTPSTGKLTSLKQARVVAGQILGSKLLTALVVALFTLLLLLCINPPMAQQTLSEDERAAGKRAPRSLKKIMVWSLLVFAVTLLMPVAASYWPRSPVDAES